MLKELSPKLVCLPGPRNPVADVSSRLELEPQKQEELTTNELSAFKKDEIPSECCPVRFKQVAKAQESDEKLCKKALSNTKHKMKKFHGGEKTFKLLEYIIKLQHWRVCKLAPSIGATMHSFIQEQIARKRRSGKILRGKASRKTWNRPARNVTLAKLQKRLKRNTEKFRQKRPRQALGTLYI